ncbi:putative vomeronasal receptor-like protein 4 [Tachyglossus aculeatus]|uniref:putative vomeronasal receptor-like protein 4 n=1 Tax=Tachyglossus aculeatus TaxID=9261 RepID=UPI0018F483CD|nr:putative vomeronasal receptor-like protein 4 [Tachyglossus aculeatus]
MLTFSNDVVQGICFFFQTGLGVMGNSLLISLHISTILLEPKLKATDLVIVHLAHTVTVLTRMVTVSSSAQRLRLLKMDIGCKTFAYVYRVTRGPSICTTCLLSTVQAMIIIDSSSLWTQLKARVRKNILPIFILLWLLNSIVDINLLFNTIASPNVTILEPRFRSSSSSDIARSCFVTFYCTDFILSLFMGSSFRNNITLLNVNMFMVSGYAMASSFLLLSSNSKLATFTSEKMQTYEAVMHAKQMVNKPAEDNE